MVTKKAWSIRRSLAVTSLLIVPLSAFGQGFSRTEVTRYFDDSAKWVLGQVASRSIDGLVVEETSFSSMGSAPERRWNFGKTKWALSYNPNGTVATSTDGNGNTTVFGDWKLGIPQLITYADGSSQSAIVNGHGWVTQVADENGYITRYSHDPMGRLQSIVYPGGDAVEWAELSQSFVQVQADEYGIGPGHWRQQVSTGSSHRVSYFDALWQPLLVLEYDGSNPAGTQRFRGYEYDHEGRVVFMSYPSAAANSSQGVWTNFDVLGRTVSVMQDSELGVLTSTTAYLGDASGAFTLQRNARGGEVRTWYQMFDQPSYNLPTRILQPEGAVTAIDRDVLGKPTSITRGSATGDVQVSRVYHYNAAQELCASVEPESGATLLGYDGAGNLSWSAAGLPGATPCEIQGNSSPVLSRRVMRTYDVRNRLATMAYPDGNGNQVWTYTPDGMPRNITTQNSSPAVTIINSYDYNKRRFLAAESVEQPGGHGWSLGYNYDRNGFVAGISYPSGMHVDYAPNALGQPTRAGSYADEVSYYPNGGMRRFVYGNGIVREMEQNARQLPERVVDGTVLGNTYHYDRAGNVTDIVDVLDPSRTRAMTYDGLDRLEKAVSQSFGEGGQITYGYDALDNLRSAEWSGGRKYAYWYDLTNRLTNVIGESGSTVVGLAYDVQGNLAARNGQEFQFDFGNRLRSVPGKEAYRYDGHGRRTVSSLSRGSDIISMYGLDGVLRRQDDQRIASVVEYIHLNGSLVAKVAASTAPPAPAIEVPAYSPNGSFVVKWSNIPSAMNYELHEQFDGGGWRESYSGSGQSVAMSAKVAGLWGYRARSCRQSVCGSWSQLAAVAVKVIPSGSPSVSAPALSVTGNYRVAWTAVPGATVYRADERMEGGQWKELSSSSDLALSVSGRSAADYSYRARACNDSGCGAVGDPVTVRVVLPPSSTPEISAPANSADGTYSIGWLSVPRATSYRLEERGLVGGWALLYDGEATSHAVAGRPNGTYQYRLVACNDGGCSDYSPVVRVEVLLPPSGSPELSLPSSSVSGDYVLGWSALAFATHYRVEQSVNGSDWSLIQQDGGTSRSFAGVASATYSYRVQACNVSGCGDWSAHASVRVLRVPATPASNYAMWDSPNRNQWLLTVNWGEVADVDYYELTGYMFYRGPERTASMLIKSVNPPRGTQSFEVRACNTSGCSAWSAVFEASL